MDVNDTLARYEALDPSDLSDDELVAGADLLVRIVVVASRGQYASIERQLERWETELERRGITDW